MSDDVPGRLGTPFDPRAYDQICFACGDRNHHGLRMRFEVDAEEGGVRCRYTPRESDQGFPGTVHGGIVSTLLDESMAWALWSGAGVLGVTAKMETRYRRVVPSDEPLIVRARVASSRSRRHEVAARIEGADGAVLAEATALFLRLPPEEEAATLARIGWEP